MKTSKKKRIERVKRILEYAVVFVVFLILVLILKGIFYPSIFYLCPDNFTEVKNPKECPRLEVETEPEVKECGDCGDNNNCTGDSCSKETDYECVHRQIIPCLGNNICEQGEYGAKDCPDCNDKDECTLDGFDYEKKACSNKIIEFCCGNSICELNESYVNCKKDCKELLRLEIIHFSKEYRIKDLFSDLTGSDKTFLVVRFKLTNLEIEEEVTMITGKTGKGYYFDPFKMKIKDAMENYYEAEYDSDLLPGFLDYTIVRKGQRVSGRLAFIIPKSLNNIKLVAQNQEGIDLAEISID